MPGMLRPPLQFSFTHRLQFISFFHSLIIYNNLYFKIGNIVYTMHLILFNYVVGVSNRASHTDYALL